MPQSRFSFPTETLHITPVTLPANTPLQAVFQQVAGDDWSLLYDSGTSTQSNSRYDIALWSPALTIQKVKLLRTLYIPKEILE